MSCEFVVELHFDLALDFVDVALEDDGLTREVFSLVFFWEGDVDFNIIVSLMADKLFFKAWDEGMRTKLKIIFLTLAAFEWNAF